MISSNNGSLLLGRSVLKISEVSSTGTLWASSSASSDVRQRCCWNSWCTYLLFWSFQGMWYAGCGGDTAKAIFASGHHCCPGSQSSWQLPSIHQIKWQISLCCQSDYTNTRQHSTQKPPKKACTTFYSVLCLKHSFLAHTKHTCTYTWSIYSLIRYKLFSNSPLGMMVKIFSSSRPLLATIL